MSQEELQLEVSSTVSTVSVSAREDKKLLGVIYGIGINVNNIIGAGL